MFTEPYEHEILRCDARILSILHEFYAADAVALVPKGGTFAMEAVTRQIMVDSVQWFCAMLVLLPRLQIFEVDAGVARLKNALDQILAA